MSAAHAVEPHVTASQWLSELYGGTPGWISALALDRTNGNRIVTWARTDDIDELARQLRPLLNRCCIWFGAATRHERLEGNLRGEEKDCEAIPGLWVDIDVMGSHARIDLPPDIDAGRKLIADFPLTPTAIIETGGGLQAWWLFHEALPVEEAKPFLQKWGTTWAEYGRRHGWHVDNVFDLARVMRLPNTFNHKHKPAPRVIVTDHNDLRYDVSDFDEWMLDPPPNPRPQLDERVPYIGPERPGDAFNAGTDPASILERAGWTFHHGDRDGCRHYTRPGKEKRDGSSATIYPDGHTIVWSDSTELEVRRSYDAFGLYTYLFHDGNPSNAASELSEAGYGTRTVDLAELPRFHTTTELSIEGAITGATFLLDQDASLTPRWGNTNEVLWAKGESLVIVGPPGVGKSTLAHQIIAALLDIQPNVITYPVLPARRVLYLAMDRPAQIRRAMRRLLSEEHRTILEDRLIVWPRPLPGDLGKNPELLVQLAQRLDCDVVVIDSIKDAAIKLTDDEVGGNFNRAVQHCLAEGVDVLALHHQRKGQNGSKPTTLEDVYGSIWLVAGAGSVILLWGEAGSELIELTHLKQPADPVGPLKLEHDHHIAVTTVSHQWDALHFLRGRGTVGATTAEAATAEHGTAVVSEANRKKTERKLKKLVERGLARRDSQGNESGGFSSVRWWVMDTLPTVDTPVDTDRETAGQTVDTDNF